MPLPRKSVPRARRCRASRARRQFPSSDATGASRSYYLLLGRAGRPALVLLLLVGCAGRLALVLLLGAGRPALAPLLGRVARPAPVLLLGPRPSRARDARWIFVGPSSVARTPRWPSFSPVLIGLLRIRSRTDEIEKSEDA